LINTKSCPSITLYLLEIKLFLFLTELPHSDLNSHLEREESEKMIDPKTSTKKHHDTEEERGWCLFMTPR